MMLRSTVRWSLDNPAPPPEGLGSEHQALLDEIAEQAERHILLTESYQRAQRKKVEAMALMAQASQEIADYDRERRKILSDLCADAQQLLEDAGAVELRGDLYVVEREDGALMLRRASVLELDR